MTRSRSLRVAVVGIVLLSACSGDDDATGGDATATSATLATPTTGPPTASTSLGPSTTETPPPTTSSTVAPTTTVDDVALAKRAVAKAAVQSRQDYLYAIRHYDAPNAIRVLRRTHAANSPSLQLGLDNMETLRSNGWRSRPNPDVPSTLTVEGEVELLDGPPATRAEATVCVIDSGVVYEPGGAPDGSDTIVNDEIIASRSRITMVLEDGRWKLFEGTNLGTWNGEATCPAA